MKHTTFIVLLCSVVYVMPSSYFYGPKTGNLILVHREKVAIQLVPLRKRVKSFEYRGPANLVIKAIHCYDMKNTDASANITAGGIGTNYFTLRLKSERSHRLDFEVEVYK